MCIRDRGCPPRFRSAPRAPRSVPRSTAPGNPRCARPVDVVCARHNPGKPAPSIPYPILVIGGRALAGAGLQPRPLVCAPRSHGRICYSNYLVPSSSQNQSDSARLSNRSLPAARRPAHTSAGDHRKPDRIRTGPVSYTHLDVYKRQSITVKHAIARHRYARRIGAVANTTGKVVNHTLHPRATG